MHLCSAHPRSARSRIGVGLDAFFVGLRRRLVLLAIFGLRIADRRDKGELHFGAFDQLAVVQTEVERMQIRQLAIASLVIALLAVIQQLHRRPCAHRSLHEELVSVR